MGQVPSWLKYNATSRQMGHRRRSLCATYAECTKHKMFTFSGHEPGVTILQFLKAYRTMADDLLGDGLDPHNDKAAFLATSEPGGGTHIRSSSQHPHVSTSSCGLASWNSVPTSLIGAAVDVAEYRSRRRRYNLTTRWLMPTATADTKRANKCPAIFTNASSFLRFGLRRRIELHDDVSIG